MSRSVQKTNVYNPHLHACGVGSIFLLMNCVKCPETAHKTYVKQPHTVKQGERDEGPIHEKLS